MFNCYAPRNEIVTERSYPEDGKTAAKELYSAMDYNPVLAWFSQGNLAHMAMVTGTRRVRYDPLYGFEFDMIELTDPVDGGGIRYRNLDLVYNSSGAFTVYYPDSPMVGRQFLHIFVDNYWG